MVKKYLSVFMTLVISMTMPIHPAYAEAFTENTRESFSETTEDADAQTVTFPADTGYYYYNPIDFASLQAQYPDIYAWVYIQDTLVDYPVLQYETTKHQESLDAFQVLMDSIDVLDAARARKDAFQERNRLIIASRDALAGGEKASRIFPPNMDGTPHVTSAPQEDTQAEETDTISPEEQAFMDAEAAFLDYRDYYLLRDMSGQYSLYGCIFTEDLNSKDFMDSMTVLYGHNMNDRTMFGSLHNFEDRDFFESHREILIYLPEAIYHYTIFAAYKCTNRHILNTNNFSDTAGIQDYLDHIQENAISPAWFAQDVTPTVYDKMISLSTCTGDSDYRYVVQGILTGIETAATGYLPFVAAEGNELVTVHR